ncbi:MAG: 4Fe-4S binding protein [Candidatus Izemoplasmataceae bacterium]
MIEKTGVAHFEDYIKEFPEDTVLEKPKAIIECYKEIPCNPCETSCPFGAITVGEDINTRPLIDYALCTGCGICASKCPGLAISIRQLEKKHAKLTFPYEFLPRPKPGETVNVVDREGAVIAQGKVLRVLDRKPQNKTALITLEVDKEHLHAAAAIEVVL